MIKLLASLLSSLPKDMPKPTITANSQGDGVYLQFNFTHDYHCANMTIQLAELHGCEVIAWCVYPSLTTANCVSGSVADPKSVIPAALTELIAEFHQTVQSVQQQQNESVEV